MKKSFKVAIAGALALLMIAVFGAQLFAADKVVGTTIPAAGVSVNAFCSNVPGVEVADFSTMQFTTKNSEQTMGGATVPIIYVRNPESSDADKDFMVYSIDGTLPAPEQISELFLESVDFQSVAELKTWLLSVIGNKDVVSGNDELIPAYTHPDNGPVEAVTWSSLVEDKGAITSMNFTGMGVLDPSDSTGKTITEKNETEILTLFNSYQPVSFSATSCEFTNGDDLTANYTETEKDKAEAYNNNQTPPTGETIGTWIITITKADVLRNCHYVTAAYDGENAKYDKVAWVLNHSYPVLSFEDTFADAGSDYAALVERIYNSYSAQIEGFTQSAAEAYARLFTYATTQHALYYHTDYAIEDPNNAGSYLQLGNEVTAGVPELAALYAHLTADRNYTAYATRNMNNNLKLYGSTSSSIAANNAISVAKNDNWNYYGPFYLNSDLFTAGDITLTLSGFDTTDGSGNPITNVPKLATADDAARADSLSVRQGQEFFIAIAKDYSTENVSGMQLNFTYSNGVAEGAEKSRMFTFMPDQSASDPEIYAPLAVGATTAPSSASDEQNLPTFLAVTGRMLTFTATGENNAPLSDVEILVKDASGAEVARGRTNSVGKYVPSTTFTVGEAYTYFEVNVPGGYALNTNQFTVTVAEDNQPEPIPNVKTQVEIRKLKESDRTTPMPGATIAIYNVDDPSTVITYLNNDEYGRFSITGLPWGEYQYREQILTAAPDTYEPTGSIYTFAIAQDGAVSGTLVFYGGEESIPGQATIRVVDDAGNPIVGATVKVYEEGDEDNTSNIYTTNAQGYITTGTLEEGEYCYKATAVPEGYTLNDTEYVFDVDNLGAIEPAPVDIVCQRVLRPVILTAYDTVTNNGISNVEIIVYPVGDTESAVTITTGTEGTAQITLPYGDYVFEQKTAVTGYTNNTNKYYFSVATSVSGDTRLPLTPGTATNTPTTTTTDGTITVIAGDTGTALAGAIVRVYNSTGAIVHEGTTDATGKTALPTTLVAGTYTYKMVSAPSGYALNTSTYTFTKNADGTYTGLQSITAPVVSVSIKKVDASNTSKALAGATMTLYSSTGTALQTKVTGSDGTATFTKLAYGSYYIKETAAPSGYTLSSQVVSFTIDSTYVNQAATMFMNSTAVQTGGEMVALYGIIFALGLLGTGYMIYRRRVLG